MLFLRMLSLRMTVQKLALHLANVRTIVFRNVFRNEITNVLQINLLVCKSLLFYQVWRNKSVQTMIHLYYLFWDFLTSLEHWGGKGGALNVSDILFQHIFD